VHRRHLLAGFGAALSAGSAGRLETVVATTVESSNGDVRLRALEP